MYALMNSECLGCGAVFSYNPKRVPSLPIDGVRQPICKTCIEVANRERIEKGDEPHAIHPDAYAPVSAEEI